jgi:hypothetical protein
MTSDIFIAGGKIQDKYLSAKPEYSKSKVTSQIFYLVYLSYFIVVLGILHHYKKTYFLFLLSRIIVTGPSLVKCTFISAPNFPVFISFPSSA